MADTYEITVAFADELAAHGLRHVCISPGSRSTPLALTFARHPLIEHWVHHDERSAAFFALGVAKTTGMPAAVITTSGTAAAELYPAVIEARFGRVPVLMLTADRPPQLRGTGANQTIDQVNLYGTNVKWFHDGPLAAVTETARARATAAQAWGAALTPPAGPVHINFPFDEPLTPSTTFPEFGADTRMTTWTAPSNVPDESAVRDLAEMMAGRRGVILTGPHPDGALAPAITDLARATGFPVLADPLSGLRAGHHNLDHVVAHYDALTQAAFVDSVLPQMAIRFGAAPTSKAINSWLASHPQVAYAVVDETGWPDPGGTARLVLAADPAATAGELAKLITQPAPPEWLQTWLNADANAAAALAVTQPSFSELDAVATVLTSVPEPATLWVASSMPIRHVDLLLKRTPRTLRLLANRGASGIDGFISSGIGSAVADPHPTYLLSGDLSLLHDLTALGWAGRHEVDITMVVINNDGGGIFQLLPQAAYPEFEELFGTPHGLDFADAAALFGLGYSLIDAPLDLASAVAKPPAGPHLVEVRFDRAASALAYRDAVQRVQAGLSN